MEIFGFICLMIIGIVIAIVGILRIWVTTSFAGTFDYLGAFFIIAGLFLIVWGTMNSPFKIVMEHETQRISTK